MRSLARHAVALLLLGALAAACVEGVVLPGDCDASAVERQAILTGELLDPSSIDVCRGQHVTLEVTSRRAGVVHLHGYDEEAPATEVGAGETITLAFTASRPGQFPIELHPAQGEEIEVGLLTVHEP